MVYCLRPLPLDMNSCWPAGTESWRSYLYYVSLPLLYLSQLLVGLTQNMKKGAGYSDSHFNVKDLEFSFCATEEAEYWGDLQLL